MGEATQKERMLAGRYYLAVKDQQLVDERVACRALCSEYNKSEGGRGPQESRRLDILERMFAKIDRTNPPFVEPPFTCDYGYNISLGAGVYINFQCCFLDCNTISIGDDTLIGPYVQIYTPGHPIDPDVRDGMRGPEFAHPVSIGKNCWIGGGAIILGGVTIGDGSIVGAGAVVTRDVPAWTVVGGNPARAIRTVKPGGRSAREQL